MNQEQLETAISLQSALIERYQKSIQCNPYGTTADEMQRLAAAVAVLSGLESLRQKLTKPITKGVNGNGTKTQSVISLGEK